MENHYKYVVLGASITGISIMEALGANAICLEATGFAGKEYSDALNPGWNQHWNQSGDFFTELCDRNILTGRGICLPALGPVLLNWIKEKRLNVLFYSKVVGIDRTADGFCIRYFNAEGFHVITASHIVDTESVSIFKKETVTKSIHAFILGENSRLQYEECNIYLHPGAFERDYYLQVGLDAGDRIDAAREKVHTFWLHRPMALQDAKLVYVSLTMNVIPLPENEQRTGQADYIRLPSSAAGNPLAAWEAGKEWEVPYV